MKKKAFNKEVFDGDVLELYRTAVGTIKLSDIKEFDSLRGNDRLEFLKFCSMVYSNVYFLQVMKQIIFDCTLNAALTTRTFDEVLVNRAEANGVKLVEDFFAKYNNKYIDEFETEKEVIDERSPFNSVT